MNILEIFINSILLIISFDRELWEIITLSLYVSFTALIIASIIGSLNLLPNTLTDYISSLSKILFAISMAGIGLTVNIKDLKGSALKVSMAVIFATLLMITIGVIGINLFNFE